MSASQAKGTRAESAVVTYLRENGYPYVERRALAGSKDRGDIAGVPVTVEVKSAARVELAAWLDEAGREAVNAGTEVGVVWFKRRGRSCPGEWFVLMDGASLVRLMDGAPTQTPGEAR